jgi:nicotinamidase-related amidase
MKALIIIDVQLAMFEDSNPVYQGEDLLEKIRALISKARSVGMPIIYVQHNAGPGKPLEPGKSGWDIHPLIKPEDKEVVIQKKTPDSFYCTTLQEELDSIGVKELIIAGIQTEICVDTTCRHAFSLGYKVTLLGDVHSTWHTDHLSAIQIIKHHNMILRWFADVRDSNEVIKELSSTIEGG